MKIYNKYKLFILILRYLVPKFDYIVSFLFYQTIAFTHLTKIIKSFTLVIRNWLIGPRLSFLDHTNDACIIILGHGAVLAATLARTKACLKN